ncbi:competence protein CoiA family protein [Streptomyces minutiscleroticus]|uniref:competence protein CoiA family protein n=1 Tax=Streptomyces minutiscleroticus TaxID=68238 RepID=UPI00167D2266|nr:competence protein CoiA [Streptomyces minutiscleroticus]
MRLTCDECGHNMYAKTSRTGLRFFAHAPGAPACALNLESVAHHLLKLELANAARDAGAHAELEARGPDGMWRADVLASDPAGTWMTALEAQLAPITDADISARADRMKADGVTSIWFSDRPRPSWLGAVPSVRVARPDGERHLTVAEGLVKFNGCGWSPVRTTLSQFLAWAFTRHVVPHTPRALLRYSRRPLATVWTAPQYVTAETSYLEEEERRRRAREAQLAALRQQEEKKREGIRARNAVTRTKALTEATAAEQAARTQPPGRLRQVARLYRRGIDQALAKLAEEHGVTATVGYSTGDPRYAGGVPLVDERGVPVAVFDPNPHRVRGEAFLLLAGLPLIFPSRTEQRRFENAANIKKKHQPVDGYRTDFVEVPADGSTCPCTCRTTARCKDPERGVPSRTERADGPGRRSLPRGVPCVWQPVRQAVAPDQQFAHSPGIGTGREPGRPPPSRFWIYGSVGGEGASHRGGGGAAPGQRAPQGGLLARRLRTADREGIGEAVVPAVAPGTAGATVRRLQVTQHRAVPGNQIHRWCRGGPRP